MARLSIICVLLVVVFTFLEITDAASRIARSPQYGMPHGIPPPPFPRGYGPDCGPHGPPGRFDRGPGRFDRGPGRFDRGPGRFDSGPSHHGHGHNDRDKYDIPPGGSISISKTISISSGSNAQSSASSSAGSSGGSSAGSNAESSASGK